MRYSILAAITSIILLGCTHLEEKPKDSEAQSSIAIFDEILKLVREGNIEDLFYRKNVSEKDLSEILRYTIMLEKIIKAKIRFLKEDLTKKIQDII